MKGISSDEYRVFIFELQKLHSTWQQKRSPHTKDDSKKNLYCKLSQNAALGGFDNKHELKNNFKTMCPYLETNINRYEH
jgi:hypothetical protein